MAKKRNFRLASLQSRRADSTLPCGLRFLDTSVPGDLSRFVRDCVVSGDLASLFEYQLEPRDYLHASDFALAYQALSLFSKFPFEGYRSEEARKAEAIKKFEESELQCGLVARALRDAHSVRLQKGVTAASVLYTARRKISVLLGDFCFSRILPYVGFGPGASTGHPRRNSDLFYKLGALPQVTAECEPLMLAAIFSFPKWEVKCRELAGGPLGLGVLPLVPGNRITTVPKNAKTERTIAIEPEGNMFLQKGIGGVIRSCLRKVGINLNDQTPNQRAALQGSRDGSLATIDLSAASDSISMSLVRELLPPDWVRVLEQTRSPVGLLPDGKKVLYRKVSSMGNGFTFELESLIFWALCSAVVELCGYSRETLLVYGDDIVCDSKAATDIITCLAVCGFKTNADKTFVDGPFRESCGKHYFAGEDVTPIYIRKGIDNVKQVYWFHNSVVQWYERTRSIFYLEQAEYDMLLDWRRSVPSRYRCYIPYAARDSVSFPGDVGFIANFSEAKPQRDRHVQCYFTHVFSVSRDTVDIDSDTFLLRQLWILDRLPVGAEGGDSRVTNARELTRRSKYLVDQWDDYYLVV